MSKGRSLELYFVDGRPDGMLTAEVFNWTGHVLRIPKIRLPDGLQRPEAKQTGVYVLLGQDDNGPLAYIGEAENMADRLRQHASQKDWWDEAVLITTSGDALHKAHVKYLESRLVEIAKDAGVMRLENGNIPTRASLNEAATANMESFLETLHMVLPAIRVDLFQSNTLIQSENASDPQRPTTENDASPEFELLVHRHGLKGKAVIQDGQFLLKSGSIICSETTIKTYSTRVADRRAQASQQGIIEISRGHAVLAADMIFNSPSAAANFVTGRSTNGRKEWKLPDGRTYSEWEDSQLTKAAEGENQ